MSEELSNLKQLLGGYFHQDWPLEADSGDQVLRQYADHAPKALRWAVAQEIADLLRSSDSVVGETVHQLGSYYDPSVEGLSMRQWLEKVKEVLQAE